MTEFTWVEWRQDDNELVRCEQGRRVANQQYAEERAVMGWDADGLAHLLTHRLRVFRLTGGGR